MTTKILFLKDTLSGLAPLGDLDDDGIGRVLNLLLEETPGGAEEMILRLATTLAVSEDDALAFYRSLAYATGEGADASLETEGLITELSEAIQRSDPEDPVKDKLAAVLAGRSKNLLYLLDPYGKWRSVQKKKDLLGGIVNSVQAVRTVCDLRPIFDEKRENIIDAGVTVTIEFLVVNQEGHAQQMILSADPETLDTIVKKLNTAQRKVATVMASYEVGKKR